MSNPTNAILQSAFDLIEQNNLEEAQNLLEPLLESESNNPAFWWVYAHAVQNPKKGAIALDKVIQLDPTYPGASELKLQISPTKPIMSSAQDTIDDWDDLALTSDTEISQQSSSRRSPIRFLLIAIILIVIVVGILGILSGALGNTTQPPTAIAGQSNTAIPTANVQIITNVSATEMATDVATEIASTQEMATEMPTNEPTEVSPTDEPTIAPSETASYLSQLIENLSEYEVSETDLQTRQTPFGATLDVTICAVPGAESSLALNNVMDILVGLNSTIPEETTAFAVTLADCNNEASIPRTIGVERGFVQSFIDGKIALKDFQREWKPLP